jgi:hypothetical protein
MRFKVTPNQVRAAKLRLVLDEKLGRESDEAVKAIARAQPPAAPGHQAPANSIQATRVEIAAAKVRLLVDARLGRESDDVIKAIASAIPVDDDRATELGR